MAWKVGIGGKGNPGVAAFVAQTIGSIGYVEYAYAKQNKLAYTLLQNASGAFVRPLAANFAAAAVGADWKQGSGQLSAADQPAGRPVLADLRRDLHPGLQEADQCRRPAMRC